MKVFRTLGIALLTLLVCSAIATAQDAFSPGRWTRATTPPQPGVGHALLLTDGSVLAISGNCNARTGRWFRLVPDSTGSYITGTWLSGGTLPAGYNPLYFASAVLPSGNVLIMGGEYNACVATETTLGAMYNSKFNRWTSVAAPAGWSTIGDASSVVLPNGKFMLANCCTSDEAIATVGATVTWTPTGAGKADANSEEGWLLLPGGNVLTVDANNIDLKHSEIYHTATGTWTSAGSTVVQLDDTDTITNSHEVGPMVLRPDGTVIAAGATTNNAVYTIATGKWAAAPKFGGTLDDADGPAALLPDGNVLFDVSPGVYNNGAKFFEWDGAAFHSVPAVPNAPIESSYAGNMVILPTGQILFTDSSARRRDLYALGKPLHRLRSEHHVRGQHPHPRRNQQPYPWNAVQRFVARCLLRRRCPERNQLPAGPHHRFHRRGGLLQNPQLQHHGCSHRNQNRLHSIRHPLDHRPRQRHNRSGGQRNRIHAHVGDHQLVSRR